ncbi:MAG: aldo/keto reductase [Clostridia bacterium]|uniref:aldo/keto reductase n=1 Tax=Petroclostridium xylanilyticum TaxID=1792311 RepID=UPI000B98B355|nr:aldo/keto reductase [Petroclostridium xylanilyticum]MBZ4647670.1 aldo/keto reductase [Clostridia bacterium]
MQYKEYGKTGKKVSVIGFGGMRFRKEDYSKSMEKCAAVVRRASELGVNYFDTAPNYCDDKSEEIMGEAFKDMPNPFYVSTKSAIWSEKNADDVRRRIEKSLKRMGLEKITFFNMWCILNLEQYRKVMAPGGPYEGALKAKEEGLIEHIVFSTHCNGEDIETIVNEGYFEGVTLGYNATNFAFRQRGIKAAYEKGLGVVTMNPLGGGIIPQNPEFYSFIKENENDSLVQAALKFNASHKEITVVLPGMGTIEEVEENVKAGENFGEMTEEKLNKMAKMLNESLDALCTGCQYCKGCPKDIEIPKYMDAYNMYILNKENTAISDRLKWHWGMNKEKAAECIECGKCEAQCTQHLPIIERLKYIANI